jgi:membrane protein implicated in regulation of membrane protease activity
MPDIIEPVISAIELWQWLVLGIALCVVEVFITSFTILWFGLAAFIVAALSAVFPLSLSLQLAIWAIATTVLAVAWFRYFKPRMRDKTKAGISREAAVGQIGTVIKISTEHARGLVRFTVPLLGEGEWPYICENPLQEGDRCRVIDVLGNALLVEKF